MDQWGGNIAGAWQYWENENVLVTVSCKENLYECSYDRQNPQRIPA